MSDSDSVFSSHSSGSITLAKMACPHCAKDLQARAMFAHIRKFHYADFLKSTSKRFIEEAETGKPLRVYWTVVNDFDEETEISIYACLSTNKTFTSIVRAEAHFAKEKAALKDHNKQLKQIKKDFITAKKQRSKSRKQDPLIHRYNMALESNDVHLARSLWRGILNEQKTCELGLMICQRRGYVNETPCYVMRSNRRSLEITYAELKLKHQTLMNEIDEYKNQKCLNAKILSNVWRSVFSFWRDYYVESLMGFHEDLKQLQSTFNHQGDDEFYGFATAEMEGVDF